MLVCFSGAGVALALPWGSRRKNCVASVLHRPPTSIANACSNQLGVCPFFVAPCWLEGCASILAPSPTWLCIACEWRNKGSVDSKLGTVPHRESICDDFDGAVIEALHSRDVEVAESCVHGDTCTGFPAHPRSCPFEYNSRPKPKQKLSPDQPSQAGNTTRQPLSTEQPGQGYTTASMQPAKPCSIPKRDLLPAGLSPQFHIPQARRILTTFFAFSCSAAFGFHYPLPNELVGAVAILTHLATTERPVPGRGCCEAEGYHEHLLPTGVPTRVRVCVGERFALLVCKAVLRPGCSVPGGWSLLHLGFGVARLALHQPMMPSGRRWTVGKHS